jgi:hypothetical protein
VAEGLLVVSHEAFPSNSEKHWKRTSFKLPGEGVTRWMNVSSVRVDMSVSLLPDD